MKNIIIIVLFYEIEGEYMNERFLIIDGNSIGCRAAFACPKNQPDICTTTGIPTGTIVRFFNMFNKILLNIKPTHLVVAWDTNSNTFRKQLYPEYKANRHKDSKNEIVNINIMHKQFKMIQKMLSILNIKYVNIEGYEGDDICGSFANISKADTTYIASGDRDSFQLVNDKVFIIYPGSGFSDYKIIDKQYILDKFEVSIENYIGLKMLNGDVSDNIPGFAGCGNKTAVKLLNEFKTVEAMKHITVDDLGNYNKKIKSNLENWQQRFDLLKALVTIKTDINLPLSYEDCKIECLDWNEIIPYMEDLEMKVFIERIQNGRVYSIKEGYIYESLFE